MHDALLAHSSLVTFCFLLLLLLLLFPPAPLLPLLRRTRARKLPRLRCAAKVRETGEVEDGIFCWRTRSVGGHKRLCVARKGGFHYDTVEGRNFSRRDALEKEERGGGEGLIENLIRW